MRTIFMGVPEEHWLKPRTDTSPNIFWKFLHSRAGANLAEGKRRWGRPTEGIYPGIGNQPSPPAARQFRFASRGDLRMVTPSHKRGVRRAGLRLKDDRLLYPPNLMRVMPP
jgi:hypothetical protein